MKQNTWLDIGQISTIESLQSEEYDIVIASLLTTKGFPMPTGNLYRANVANVTAEGRALLRWEEGILVYETEQ